MGPELLISILVFGGTVLAALGIVMYTAQRRGHREIIDKVKHAGIKEEIPITSEEPGAKTIGGELRGHVVRIASTLGERVKPKKQEDISHMQKTFLQAGIRAQNAVVLFFGAKILCAIILLAAFVLLRIFLLYRMLPLQVMLVSIAVAVFGFYLPDIWLKIRTANRKDKITRGFPDALDLLVVCVEAGMGLDAAINRVAEEISLSNKILSDELKVLNLELRAGKPRRDALQDLAVRTGLEDVSSLVTLLIQTDKFGTSIARALRVHSDSMRTARFQRAEELAAKLPVKLLIPLIFFIFPSLFVVIIGPAGIRIAKAFKGVF